MTAETTREEYVFTFQCPDRLGILAKVSGLLFQYDAFVNESQHYGDPDTEKFFARLKFSIQTKGGNLEELKKQLATLAVELDMESTIHPVDYRPKVLIAVSKFDHCLNMLLNKWHSNALNIDIVGIVSNHEDCRRLAEWYGIPYHYFPITAETKSQQEGKIIAIYNKTGADVLVLARYMQILSDDLSRKLEGKAINIHHSFLPGFKGARPYHQAHTRGVKVIGATAHFVTSDLDEGPIIVQEVRSVNHTYSAEDMILVGQDTESVALSAAVRLFSEHRVFLNNNRTIVL